MCIKSDDEKNAFLKFFPLNLETNPIVLTDESNLEDDLPQGKILALFLLKIMKFSTSKTFISYEILTLNTHDTMTHKGTKTHNQTFTVYRSLAC